MPVCIPIYDPAHAFTGRATGAAVTGCRVVCVAATKADGEPVPIKHCGATDKAIGVSADDCAQNAVVAVYPPGMVVPILVGGTGATAGAKAEVMATGVVQDHSAGTDVGVFLTTTAAAGFALVQLQI